MTHDTPSTTEPDRDLWIDLPYSPACEVLIVLLGELAEPQKKLNGLQAKHDALTSLISDYDQTITRLKEELAGMDAADLKALDDWINAPSDPKPQSDHVRRTQIAHDLTEAEKGKSAAERIRTDNEPAQTEVTLIVAELNRKIDTQVINALYEKAEALGRRYKTHLEHASQVLKDLSGLNAALKMLPNFYYGETTPRPGVGCIHPPAIMWHGYDLTIRGPALMLEQTPGNRIGEFCIPFSTKHANYYCQKWMKFRRVLLDTLSPAPVDGGAE